MAEVCELYGVVPLTIKRWMQSRNFPGQKFGALWRFDPAAVAAWDEAQLVPQQGAGEAV